MKELYQRPKRSLKPPHFALCVYLLICSSLLAEGKSYGVKGDHLSRKEAVRLWAGQAKSVIVIKGRVTDEGGGGIPGVSVNVSGDTKAVVTDKNGDYTIDVKPTDKLIFSYIGMETQTIEVGSRLIINVKLLSKSDGLDEVTIVAFGKQKKESVIASVTTINPGELKQPSSNLTHALSGRIAGVTAYQRSGEPGANNADFFIRGVTSFGYSNRPLILIDGVEMTTTDLARMQVDDIGSFSIMKDASATALYGARGANGVVLVTTKEGKEGKGQISVRYETSRSSSTKDVDIADPITFMNLQNEAVLTRNPLGIAPYSQEKIENTMAGNNPLVYPAVDWHSMLFNDHAINNRLNLNLSGGGKVARYYVAGSYNKDNGLLKVDKANNFNNNIDLKQYELRSNVNINLTKTTEAKVVLNTAWTDYNGPLSSAENLYKQIIRTNPVLYPPVFPKEPGSNINHILFGNTTGGYNHNPYAEMVHGYKDYTKSMVSAQFQLQQKLDFIIDGLSMRAMYNNTRYADFDVARSYNPFYYSVNNYDRTNDTYTLTALNPAEGTPYLGYDGGVNLITTNNYIETSINYNSTFSKSHSVSGMLIYTMRNRLIANAGSLQASLPGRNMGVSGRFTYGYKSRYFVEANFGYNGSERFSEKNRFGFFPSIGAGWIVSNESFWTESMKQFMPKLKLKATNGLMGNDIIGSAADRFFFLSQVNLADAAKSYNFGSDFGSNVPGVSISRYANADITWEKARMTNLGVEINLFNAFDINADFWWKNTTNILQTRADIPTTMGLQVIPRANVGEAKSKGFEVSLDYQKSFSGGWWITGRGNFTFSSSEFTKYEEPDYSATPWKSRIGQPIGQVWGFVAERLFVDEKEVANSPFQTSDAMAGDIKYKDINDDRIINELDMVPIGFPTAGQINYGLGLTTGNRSVDFSCFFQGNGRESFWINHDATAPFVDVDGVGSVRSTNAVIQAYADSHWSEQNRDLYALWPRLSNTLNSNNRLVNTWFMRNSSFIRLKSVEVGYTLPSTFTKKMRVTKIRVYGNGTNLLTFSNFKLWDPEMAGNGLGYPIQRIINFGINCTF